jgi:hypothetical protein
MTCELCLLEKRTKWYFENNEFAILECDTCNIPMCVWKQHGGAPSRRVITDMHNKAKELFGPSITFRTQMKRIPDHFHFHVNLKL